MAIEIISEGEKTTEAKVKEVRGNCVIASVKGAGDLKVVCPQNAEKPKVGADIGVRVNLSPSGKPNRAFYIATAPKK